MKLFKLFTLLLMCFSLCFVSCGDCTEKNWYTDADGDGFGTGTVLSTSCDNPGGAADNNFDQDDTDATINPNRFWTGTAITVTKLNDADWLLASNQDRLTDNVWLTRQDKRGLFNIVTEEEQIGSYIETLSPADTEWAVGSISDGVDNLQFDRFVGTLQNNVGSYILMDPLVLHLITDDIYIDVNFTSWSMNDSGGGFSYQRSTKLN